MTEIPVAISFRILECSQILSLARTAIRFSKHKQAVLSRTLSNIVYILLIIYMEGNMLAPNAPASTL
jgi:hypothetical protein